MKIFPVFSALLGILVSVIGLELDVHSKSSIQKATSLIAQGLLDYYEGTKYGGTIGMFSWPYYWWEAGGAWGSLIDYSYYTENDTLVPIIKQALTYQTGEDDNYIPLNQSTTEGNDDQGFWGIAVMAAAEKNFSNPSDPKKAWLTLAQAVFNTMSARWDTKDCGGGLRWQIFQWNSGYDYKNTVSTGCLFNIAARLARYTGNDSYSDWAEKIWEWFDSVGLLAVSGDSYYIYDGVEAKACENITKYQWTYNQGLLLSGCAFLYNHTEDEVWHNRTKALLKGSRVFFQNDTMYEAACQPANTCSQDQRSFKAYFSRFLGLTAVMAPETSDTIMTWLTASAKAAAQSCSGGTDGHTCGTNWFKHSWDGNYGLGEQMCALEVIQNLRVHDLPPPYTAHEGGSSIGNPAAGYSVTTANASPLKLDGGDKAGAAIITIIISASLIGSGIWLIL
ncbi:Piso0_001924 [Millerozyma farinosa CBS 7064]|uniref:Mannan endo-1,6-alpha-mannosidase n=1 Tax=Pichia sorbitophila (strain ATCC MYA-4447 / BCRC 22081 / CBS 7064 / NBRC 10061 / NRRL Y-12695) TaxID=559304 RepID=G8YM23_PICSO|nr:Piso0_001924 [Millerozyma farinosa CBS 7064]